MIPINVSSLQDLNHHYHTNVSTFHIIYGASSSGKTTFIRDFVTKKNVIYFANNVMTPTLLFNSYAHTINKKFNLKNSTRLYKTFQQSLDLLNEYSGNEKLSIIFDDFTDLLKADKNALVTLFTYYKNNYNTKNIQIILSSSIYLKNKNIQKYVTNTIQMDKFADDNIFMQKNIVASDKFYIHSCFGNSQYILALYNIKIDFIKNIYNLALEPNGAIFSYGFTYIRKEINDIPTYMSILYAISRANHKLKDIANFLQVESSYLTRYILKLQDLMIIRKELPLTDTISYSKFGRYYINDNYLRFWFCYIFANTATLELKKHAIVAKEINDTVVKYILTPNYKEYIKRLIIKDPSRLLGFEPINYGSWWDNNGNYVDIVAYNETDISFVKVLWENKDIAKTQYQSLKTMSDNYKTTLNRNYIIISKNTYLQNQI